MGGVLTELAMAAVAVGATAALALDAFSLRREALLSAMAGLVAGMVLFAASGLMWVEVLWGVMNSGGRHGVIATFVCGLAALTVYGGSARLAENPWGGSIAGLMGFGALSAVTMALSVNLTLLLIGLEAGAACGYALVATGGMSGSREAAMKYFVQGAIATAFFLFALAVFIGGLVASGDVRSLAKAIGGAPSYSVVAIGAVLGSVALAFKTGSAPFHTWVPDAYETASWDSAAFLASSVKIGGVAALVSFEAAVMTGRLVLPLSLLVAVLATASILVGSVGALMQRSYARMLAYAGIAQVGYALVAVANGDRAAALLFVVTYSIASAGAFVAGAAFRRVRPGWDGTTEGLTGIAHEAPVLGFAVGALMVSLVGIPPLVGFWGKLVVFASALSKGVDALAGGSTALGTIGLVTGAAGIIGSAISVAYYGTVLRVLYDNPSSKTVGADDVAGEGSGAAAVADGALTHSASGATVGLAVLTVSVGCIPLLLGVETLSSLFG